MGPLAATNVIYATWDHMGLSKEVARLNAEMKVLSEYAVEMAQKHNCLLEDTTGAMRIIEAGMHDHNDTHGLRGVTKQVVVLLSQLERVG